MNNTEATPVAETTNSVAPVKKTKKVAKKVATKKTPRLVAAKLTKTKLKTLDVTLGNGYDLCVTQETTVIGTGSNKVKKVEGYRFVLEDDEGNFVDTTANKKLTPAKFNKKFLKEVAPTVLPKLKKLIKAGEVKL